MDGLERLRVFTRVADLASFSASARELGLAQSQVSRAVRAIEDDVGVQLFTRTTRAVSLTAEGRRYLEGVRSALSTLETADAAMKTSRDTPSGTLRVTAAAELAEVLGPILADLATRYPDLAFDGVFTDRVVDVVAEGFDIAVRSGVLAESELRAKRIGSTVSVVCAAPTYVARHGAPRMPRELAEHEVALFARKPRAEVVLQQGDGRRAKVALHGRIRVDDLRAIRAAAVAGAAIAILPEAQIAAHLATGTLVRLLPRWATVTVPIHALMPARSPQPPRVRVFLDAARDAFRARPLLRAT